VGSDGGLNRARAATSSEGLRRAYGARAGGERREPTGEMEGAPGNADRTAAQRRHGPGHKRAGLSRRDGRFVPEGVAFRDMS
jgi:hypothetical protein